LEYFWLIKVNNAFAIKCSLNLSAVTECLNAIMQKVSLACVELLCQDNEHNSTQNNDIQQNDARNNDNHQNDIQLID
jgi:hypothetical protein